MQAKFRQYTCDLGSFYYYCDNTDTILYEGIDVDLQSIFKVRDLELAFKRCKAFLADFFEELIKCVLSVDTFYFPMNLVLGNGKTYFKFKAPRMYVTETTTKKVGLPYNIETGGRFCFFKFAYPTNYFFQKCGLTYQFLPQLKFKLALDKKVKLGYEFYKMKDDLQRRYGQTATEEQKPAV